MNYDTLAEASMLHVSQTLQTIQRPLLHFSLPATDDAPVPPMPFYQAYRSGNDELQLIKLHGSTNWYWDQQTKAADSIVVKDLRCLWKHEGDQYPDVMKAVPGMVPVFVPRTLGKSSYLDNPTLRHSGRRLQGKTIRGSSVHHRVLAPAGGPPHAADLVVQVDRSPGQPIHRQRMRISQHHGGPPGSLQRGVNADRFTGR